MLQLLLQPLPVLLEPLVHVSLERVNLRVVLALYLPLLVLQLLDVVLVHVQGTPLLFFEFLQFKVKTLLLRLFHGLTDVCVLVDQGLLLTLKFILKVSLGLAQLVLCVFLQLKLFPLFLLLQLLPVYRDLTINLHFNLGPNLLFLLALVQLPPLLFLLDIRLVRLEDLLLLQFKVLVNLLDRTREVLLKQLPLLFDVLVDLRLDQRVVMLA